MNRYVSLIFFFIFLSICNGQQVINAETGKIVDKELIEPRKVYKINLQKIGGKKVAVLLNYQKSTPTSETFIWSDEKNLVAIITTKIKKDYPQDFTLLKEKIYKSHKIYKKVGKENYSISWEGEKQTLVMKEINLATSFQDVSDIQFLAHSNGFLPKPGGFVRVDRHFVKKGYYIQIISISLRSKDNQAESNADQQSKTFLKAVKIPVK